ncbi:hypothetical protein [Niallia taxi]|uniref:hypothetical protein n=1 Tax=Niallia taxi TaxID=2499688 RepID=UPI00300A4C3B
MYCYDPAEQVFNLQDKVIGIDWGKNGDFATRVIMKKEEDGRFSIVEYKVLHKVREE